MREICHKLAWLPSLAAVGYLAGDLWHVLQFAAFLLLLILPAVAIIARSTPFERFDPPLRLAVACLLTALAGVGLFYARRVFPSAAWFDGGLALGLCVGSGWRNARRHLFKDLGRCVSGPLSILPLGVLPLAFICTWTGFATPAAESLKFNGLMAVDFGNLVAVAALVKISPGLPELHVVGQGSLHYHWLYYTLPAWLSDFLGGDMPLANAVILMNLAVSQVFMLAVSQLAKAFSFRRPHPGTAFVTTWVITLAPLITYGWWLLSYLSGKNLFGDRNSMILSPINSLLIFGNNTLAVAMIVAAVLLLLRWNEEQKPVLGICLALLLSMIPAYSATMTPSVGLAFFVWFLLGRVRRPLFAAALAIGVAVLAYPLLRGLHILGGSTGLGLGFDGGDWFWTFGLCAAPLCMLTLVGLFERRELTLPTLMAAAGLIVPSLIYTEGTQSNASTFSMKSGTLVIVVMLPLVLAGVERVLRGRTSELASLFCVVLVFAGLLNATLYILQNPWMAMTGVTFRESILPANYCACLEHLRKHSPRQAIVLDSIEMQSADPVIWTAALAERRIALPSGFWSETYLPERQKELDSKRRAFDQWRKEGFQDKEFSKRYAQSVDYLIVAGGKLNDAWWTLDFSAGSFAVYRSTVEP